MKLLPLNGWWKLIVSCGIRFIYAEFILIIYHKNVFITYIIKKIACYKVYMVNIALEVYYIDSIFLSDFISKTCFVHHRNIGGQVQNKQIVHEGSFILTLKADFLWISTILLIKQIKSSEVWRKASDRKQWLY